MVATLVEIPEVTLEVTTVVTMEATAPRMTRIKPQKMSEVRCKTSDVRCKMLNLGLLFGGLRFFSYLRSHEYSGPVKDIC